MLPPASDSLSPKPWNIIISILLCVIKSATGRIPSSAFAWLQFDSTKEFRTPGSAAMHCQIWKYILLVSGACFVWLGDIFFSEILTFNWVGFTAVLYLVLSYDVAVIQWITSCHKNRMTTRYITLGYWRVTSWCRPWQRYVFFWNNVNFKGDKIPF